MKKKKIEKEMRLIPLKRQPREMVIALTQTKYLHVFGEKHVKCLYKLALQFATFNSQLFSTFISQVRGPK